MKELSIEEKAKRYDEALIRGSKLWESDMITRENYEYIFPELKESENKRMIQYFKDLAPFDKADELYEKYGFSHKDAIAWLERQVEHANFRNKIQVDDKVKRNEDGVLVNLSQLNRVAKKQGEQKPADTEKGANGNEREIPIPEPPLTIKHAKEVMGIKQNDAWSEEDEEIYRKCICAMRASACGFPEEEKFVEQVDSWLKSLKDRYTWRPSEEQIKALEKVTYYIAFPDAKYCVELKSLLEQLKAL